MSNFNQPYTAEELRVRNALGFAVGQLFLGTVANPLNFVLWSQAGKITVLTKWIVSSAAANSCTLFAVSANPSLAAGNTPACRQLFQASSQISWQTAVAASPATSGIFGAYTLSAASPINLLAGEVYTAASGQGFLVQLPAVAGNVFCAVAWFELNG